MSISNEQYKLNGQLVDNAGVHCACLGIYKNHINDNRGLLRPPSPLDILRNCTITFVKSEGKVYGITCWHVIEQLQEYHDETGDTYSHSFYTLVKGFNCIINTFINPKSENVNTFIDIAIRELNPALLESIGKVPLDLDNQITPYDIKFGYAVGFPETIRYKKSFMDGEQISMPQCEILAEINRIPKERFVLHNELENVPKPKNYSGMSGGPIFWCNGENYGIYGIAYEAGTGGELTGDHGIFVYGEYAAPEEIKMWIDQIN